MKTIIIHHNDLDGRCAAAVAINSDWGKARMMSGGILCVEMDYKDTLSLEMFDDGCEVVIVDFSLNPEIMAKLFEKGCMVTWIDHHATAAAYEYGKPLPGLRDFRDKGRSGCELAWAYFNQNVEQPLAVSLIGDYDSWRLGFAPYCFEFYEGMKLQPGASNPFSDLWTELLGGDDPSRRTAEIQRDGRTAIAYRDAYADGMRKSCGYATEIDGYRAYAMNVYGFGSKAFAEKTGEYPVCIAYIHDGTRFTVSLYSETVDVSAIAKAHGGGGHRGAAGFVCEALPFKKLEAPGA